MIELVGDREQRDIERSVTKILRDLGEPEPPLNLDSVRELLALDLKYYSSTDVGLFGEFAHRITIAGKRIAANPRVLIDAIKKAKLSGLWLPDNRQIFIDQGVPAPKHRWIQAHEITHSFVPWHSEFLLGDNELTLDPECHDTIEAEANFGAGRLLFFGRRFAAAARDCDPDFASIKLLKKRYGNTLTSTFWRFVEDRNPDVPAFGLISQHPHHPEIGAREDGSPIHHFVTSERFRKQFPHVGAMDAYAVVQRNASWKKKGPIVGGIDAFLDQDNSPVRFILDGFSNSYQLLTYGYAKG